MSNQYFGLCGLGARNPLRKRDFNYKQPLKDLLRAINEICATTNQAPISGEYAQIFTKSRAAAIKQKRPPSASNIQRTIMKFINPDLWGSSKNRVHFRRTLQMCLSQSQYEQIYESDLSHGIDIEQITWIPHNRVQIDKQHEIFRRGIKLVLLYIVLPFIFKHHKAVRMRRYEMKFYPKEPYQKHINKLLKCLERSSYIKSVPLENYESIKTRVAHFNFLPKVHDFLSRAVSVNNFRIIGVLPKRTVIDNHKYNKIRFQEINKALHKYATDLSFIQTVNFFDGWRRFVDAHKGQVLFAAKLDLTDCFGNVEKDHLLQMISLSKLAYEHKCVLTHAVNNQFIWFGRRKHKKTPIIYSWQHGLLQGMQFSNTLCEFYLSSLENTLFREFDKPHIFVFRVVDDYFIASTVKNDIQSFINIVHATFIVNDDKSQNNLNDPTKNITFCGCDIDMRNFRIKCDFSGLDDVHKRFSVLNSRRLVKREAAVCTVLTYKRNNYYFQPAFMDATFNGVQHVYQNFFASMTLLAFKLNAALISVTCNFARMFDPNEIWRLVQQTTMTYAKIVCFTINKSLSKPNVIIMRLLRLIGVHAFRLVFARNKIYKPIVKVMNEYLRQQKATSIRNVQCKRIPEALQHISLNRSSNFYKAPVSIASARTKPTSGKKLRFSFGNKKKCWRLNRI